VHQHRDVRLVVHDVVEEGIQAVVERAARTGDVQRVDADAALLELRRDQSVEAQLLAHGVIRHRRAAEERDRHVGVRMLERGFDVGPGVGAEPHGRVLGIQQRTIEDVIGIRVLNAQLQHVVRQLAAERVVPEDPEDPLCEQQRGRHRDARHRDGCPPSRPSRAGLTALHGGERTRVFVLWQDPAKNGRFAMLGCNPRG
jgi:hypothetical protein